MPRRPRRVAAAAVRNFKTASTSREQLAIGSLAVAFRLGLGDLWPDRLRVEYDPGVVPLDFEAHISRAMGQRARVCLYIGPPRAVRKPVLQILDEGGSTLAFAKLGIDPFTDDLVRGEAETVLFLSSLSWSVLAIPTVLHQGTWQGHEMLLQTAFPRGAQAKSGTELLSRAMDELARSRGVRTALLGRSPYWERLLQRMKALPRGEFSDMLERSVSAIEMSSAAIELEFGCWHGDWTPWNMTVADDRVRVWDWEKFETDVPIGFDAVHFDVQGPVVMAGTTPGRAFQDAVDHASDLLRPLAVIGAAAPLVVWLYAIDIAVRYLEDSEMTAGRTRMSRLQTWLALVLDYAASRVVDSPCQ